MSRLCCILCTHIGNIFMKNLIIIDAYSFLFRAYYALPPLTNASGAPVGAIYGFINMLFKCLQNHSINYLVIACDYGKKTFRNDLYSEYKANRVAPPDDLIPQFATLREAINAFGIKILELEGYEADDIIASLVRKFANNKDLTITIFSSDKDLMQLMDDSVKIYDSLKNRYLDSDYVIEKFGVAPDKLLDVLSLTGDKSDNIPGVPGIGIKTAAQLINEYSTLENLLENAQEIKQNKRRENILLNKQKAILSKTLITLCDSVPMDVSLEDCIYSKPDITVLRMFLEQYGLKSLVARISKVWESCDNSVVTEDLTQLIKVETILVSTIKDMEACVADCYYSGILSFQIIKDQDVVLNLNISCRRETMYIIKANEISAQSLFSSGEDIWNDCLSLFKKMLLDKSLLKIACDLKNIQHFLDVEIVFGEDLELMSYMLDSGKHKNDIKHLLSEYLSIDSDNENTPCFMIALYHLLLQKLSEQSLYNMYWELDKPLVNVFYSMEKEGILVDKNVLYNLSKEFNVELQKVENKIYEIVGHEFNIGSPKQLAVVLFDELQIDIGKKKKSTDISVLESMLANDHYIAEYIIKWRHLSKLINTYTDSLLKQINFSTSRIHTTYSLTLTSTGRLSSHNPNLQNIPVRTPEGHKIREAFISKNEYLLLSADYSQIELRLLAYMANIIPLKEALASNHDVHAITASQIFNVAISDVTAELRRKAKAINFGIIYGISAFGLAKQLSISTTEAQKYIDYYLDYYKGISEYMEATIAYAKENGYVKTLSGRRCYVPSINNKNYQQRSFAERAAINAPLQGTAADIMREAIIKIHNNIQNEDAKLLLQVHDEVILEVGEHSIDKIKDVVKKSMESSSFLDVLLPVSINSAKNWKMLK